MRSTLDHAAARARILWAAIAGCEHDFGGSMGVTMAPDDICARCGASRALAATVQRYLRSIGREVPWGA